MTTEEMLEYIIAELPFPYPATITDHRSEIARAERMIGYFPYASQPEYEALYSFDRSYLRIQVDAPLIMCRTYGHYWEYHHENRYDEVFRVQRCDRCHTEKLLLIN